MKTPQEKLPLISFITKNEEINKVWDGYAQNFISF